MIKFCCFLVLTFTCSSCVWLYPSTQDVKVTASNPNAVIMYDGESYGKGEAVIPLPRRKDSIIIAQTKKQGGYAFLKSEPTPVGAVLDYIPVINWFMFFDAYQVETQNVEIEVK